jgi:hypothetical protein
MHRPQSAASPNPSADSSGSSRYYQYKAYNRSCVIHNHPVVGSMPASSTSCNFDLEHDNIKRSRDGEDKDGDVDIVLQVPYDMLLSDPFCNDGEFTKEPYFHDKSEVSAGGRMLTSCEFFLT